MWRVVVDTNVLFTGLSRRAQQAEREGVSLNHYIVYTLTRTVTAADLEAQRQTFDELTKRYPPEEAEAALREVLAARS